MAKKKKPEEVLEAPGYMMLYSMLMTLLMAFFVCLCTMGTYGGQKFDQNAKSIRETFSTIQFSGAGEGFMAKKAVSFSSVTPETKLDQPRVGKTRLMMMLEEAVDVETKQGYQNIRVRYEPEKGIIIVVRGSVLFNPGEVTLRPGLEKLFNKLIMLFKDAKYDITIEGHSEKEQNLGVTNSFVGAWDNSVKRAVEVVKYISDKGDIDRKYLKAVGFGSFRPEEGVAKKDAMHDRIEIVLRKIK